MDKEQAAARMSPRRSKAIIVHQRNGIIAAIGAMEDYRELPEGAYQAPAFEEAWDYLHDSLKDITRELRDVEREARNKRAQTPEKSTLWSPVTEKAPVTARLVWVSCSREVNIVTAQTSHLIWVAEKGSPGVTTLCGATGATGTEFRTNNTKPRCSACMTAAIARRA